MPAEVPLLTTVRGDRYVFDLTLWADAAQTVPFPVDTADEVKAELRMDTGTAVVATFETSLQEAHVVRFVLPAEVTETLAWGGQPLRWDLQVTWGTAPPLDVRTVAKGRLAVEGDITESDAVVRQGRSPRVSASRR